MGMEGGVQTDMPMLALPHGGSAGQTNVDHRQKASEILVKNIWGDIWWLNGKVPR